MSKKRKKIQSVEQSSIEVLEDIARGPSPIDVVLARTALKNASELAKTSQDQPRDIEKICNALQSIIKTLRLEGPLRQAAITEFSTHLSTYQLLTDALNTSSPAKTSAPTQTCRKNMSGGKS
jgi:hypothetical protein